MNNSSEFKKLTFNIFQIIAVIAVVIPLLGAESCQEDYDLAARSSINGTPTPDSDDTDDTDDTDDDADDDDDVVPVETPTVSPSPQTTGTPVTAVPTTTPSPDATLIPVPIPGDNVTPVPIATPSGIATATFLRKNTARGVFGELSNNGNTSVRDAEGLKQDDKVQQVSSALRDNWLGKAFSNEKSDIRESVMQDSDGDGIADSKEEEILLSEDGGFKLITGIQAGARQQNITDKDRDGLSAQDERILGTSDNKYDSDLDGCSDAQEVLASSDPLDSTSNIEDDSDLDCLTDSDEEVLGTNPNSSDSDGDNLSDGVEVILKTNPTSVDSDNDGISDFLEVLALHAK